MPDRPSPKRLPALLRRRETGVFRSASPVRKLASLAAIAAAAHSLPAAVSPAIDSNPTFNREIAPLLFRHCSPCHRPGQSAPFNLLTFADAKKHSRDLLRAVSERRMPPWMPDRTDGPFVGQRSLADSDLSLLQRWIDAGAVEGNPADLPAAPRWTEGWELGEPDLVIRMPEPFSLPADGADLYRNFVIPIPTTTRRHVRAVEL